MQFPRRSFRWWLHGMGMSIPARAIILVLSLAVMAVSHLWWVNAPAFLLFFSCLPSTLELARRSSGSWKDDD